MPQDKSFQSATPPPVTGPPADDTLACLDDLAEKLFALSDPVDDAAAAPTAAAAPALQELRILEQAIENLSVHTENDELLADAMQEIATLVGSQSVWVVEASVDAALGPVHVLGELVIGESALPRDVVRLCENLFDHRGEGGDHVISQLPDGQHRIAMPIRIRETYFGAIVFTAAPCSAREAALRGRLITSVLRFLAVAIENRHFVDSLTEMIVEVVCGFALAIESRDPYTGGHVMRVTAFALELCEKIGLDEEELSVIRLGGLLHDIGKVAIPDDILNKDGALTEIERDIIKVHPAVGFEILNRIPHLTRSNAIVRHHHERWDGNGYPDRLAGKKIPFLARVLGITDAYDAMTSDRPYRKGRPHQTAIDEIRAGAGTQFDPELARQFVNLTEQDLARAEARMHRWINSIDHGSNISLAHLIAMKKPRI